ncbi:MAG: O-linked N-acetylglucosamine transferase, SPINDLY family protein [Aphanothece sp. CMT-3BRIN-NPC111]|jgi:predicted O-linked N-acetylglucosamine transferase (SPINDLY family)|nr:O-linked N-acetylglucosamine transferase, SPINDLY family protein [Aphanothece sp. CMT-3BRIN-NPC111]
MLDRSEINTQPPGQTLLRQGYDDQAISFYEQAIQTEPDAIGYYWHLGLAYLLQGREEEASATWLLVMSQGTPENIEQWTRELSEILDSEAQRQAALSNTQIAWLIRQHLREIAPTEVNNLLYLLLLSLTLGTFAPELLNDWQVIELLEQSSPAAVNSELLLQVLKPILEFPTEETVAFLGACLPHAYPPDIFIDTVISVAVKVGYQGDRPSFAVKLAEACIKLRPDHSLALQHLSCFYTNAGCHQQAIEVAQQFYNNCQNINSQIFGNYLLLRAIVSAGSWSELGRVAERHKSLLLQIIHEQPENLSRGGNLALIVSAFFLPYLQDNIQENRWFRNKIGQLFQKNVDSKTLTPAQFVRSDIEKKFRPLRVGYIAHTFRQHSVGWLSRWLFYYHDRELFPTTIYCLNQNLEDRFTQVWFRDKVNAIHSFGIDAPAVAAQIKNDQIDILIDLDSITLDVTCEVMALKPAPVQVTWLGWDASGIPAIDYFIADPYVLPENAQEYYQETLWQLPQTYLAVDGFEVGTPTLRREDLEIPSDAIVYLSAQKGYKRHPDTIRLQLQIIKEVPNSYFLIKGVADELVIRQIFHELAQAEKVDPGRLRFLPKDPNELVHRANLAIADVVLDTYPYNGATTTLETLWMGIPLVTRVGQQFAARNSYGFMMNVGVTEGIAWTDEEYVEWGVRLGMDEALRWKVTGKLKASRHTSPLWNAQQFTLEMEKAYRQMWLRYLETH